MEPSSMSLCIITPRKLTCKCYLYVFDLHKGREFYLESPVITSGQKLDVDVADQLRRIQCVLQDVGSHVATPRSSARETHSKVKSLRYPVLNESRLFLKVSKGCQVIFDHLAQASRKLIKQV